MGEGSRELPGGVSLTRLVCTRVGTADGLSTRGHSVCLELLVTDEPGSECPKKKLVAFGDSDWMAHGRIHRALWLPQSHLAAGRLGNGEFEMQGAGVAYVRPEPGTRGDEDTESKWDRRNVPAQDGPSW